MTYHYRAAFVLTLAMGVSAHANDAAQSVPEERARTVLGKTERPTHTAPFLDSVEVELGEASPTTTSTEPPGDE